MAIFTTISGLYSARNCADAGLLRFFSSSTVRYQTGNRPFHHASFAATHARLVKMALYCLASARHPAGWSGLCPACARRVCFILRAVLLTMLVAQLGLSDLRVALF